MFLASFHITVFLNYVRLNCRINFICRQIMHLCFNPPTKWQTLPRMKYVLCSVRKRQYIQHDGEIDYYKIATCIIGNLAERRSL